MNAPPTKLCFHCGESVPAHTTHSITINKQVQPLCCTGCEAVANLIHNNGLSNFYQFREGTGTKPMPDQLDPLEQEQHWAAYDKIAVLNQISSAYNTGTDETSNTQNCLEAVFLLENLYCGACAWLIKNTLSAYPGVKQVLVNPATHRMRLIWNQQQTPLSQLLNIIAKLGYQPHPANHSEAQSLYLNERRSAIKRLAVAGLGMMQVMMNALAIYFDTDQAMRLDIKHFLTLISLLVTTPVVIYAAKPFFIGAWRDLHYHRAGMDVPIALAIGAAYCASVWSTFIGHGEIYFDSVCMFVFFLSLGRFAELLIKQSMLHSQDAFSTLLPPTACKINSGNTHTKQTNEVLPLEQIKIGDTIQIKAGEVIPCDGTVLLSKNQPYALIDESILSGESLPQQKTNGGNVIAGSINLDETLTIHVTQIGQHTTLAHIKNLLEIARTQKPRLAQLADQISGKFVLGVLVIATLVGIFWWNTQAELAFPIVLAVLVVTCPCALSLATPTALVAASIRMSKSGLLITQSNAIEQLNQVSHIIFDKTGTLTQGKLRIQYCKTLQSLDTAQCEQIAAALEKHAHHPIAHAFHHIDTPYQAYDVKTIAGAGIEGTIDQTLYRLGSLDYIQQTINTKNINTQTIHKDTLTSYIYLADKQSILAEFACQDQPRKEAVHVIHQLKQLNRTPIIASGDQAETVQYIAEQLQIDHAEGRMTPQAKLKKLQTLQKQHCVAMVGDGINDAPVLAAANISIAMNNGSALAQSQADIILLNDNLLNLLSAINIAHKTKSIIRQNIIWALTYNIAAIPLAASGIIAPWLAAIGMSLSSLVVTLNATRIQSTQTPTDLAKHTRDRYTKDTVQPNKATT